jgi:hypothetical protein
MLMRLGLATREGALSHALCCIATEITPSHPIAADLAANNMGTLMATNPERNKILTVFLAEPKLAIAAAVCKWSLENELCNEIIPALQDNLATGVLNVGFRGELVAQIIILLAFDAVCAALGEEPGAAVPLEEVLKQLLPFDSDVDIKDAVPEVLRTSKVDYIIIDDHGPFSLMFLN